MARTEPRTKGRAKELKQMRNEKAQARRKADSSQDGPTTKKRKTTAYSPTPQADTGQNDDSIPFVNTEPHVQSTTTNKVPAPSIIGNEALLAELSNTYNVTTMSIISASQIQKKATRVLELLNMYPMPKGEKESVVFLYAKAKVASKMISVVEIVKREIAGKEGKWYQYNAVGELMEERKAKNKDPEKGVRKLDTEVVNGVVENASTAPEDARDVDEDDEDSGSEAFETMKTPFERAIEGKPKVRAVPVMSVYLSRERVDRLRKAYGEQTNGIKKA